MVVLPELGLPVRATVIVVCFVVESLWDMVLLSFVVFAGLCSSQADMYIPMGLILPGRVHNTVFFVRSLCNGRLRELNRDQYRRRSLLKKENVSRSVRQRRLPLHV